MNFEDDDNSYQDDAAYDSHNDLINQQNKLPGTPSTHTLLITLQIGIVPQLWVPSYRVSAIQVAESATRLKLGLQHFTFTLIDDHVGIRYGKTKKVQGAAHDAVRSIYCNQMNPYLCFGFNIRLIFICVNETMNSKFLLKNEYRLLFLIHVIISSQK